nr:preprotein translocase subunit SecE [Methylobacterium sp. Leaf112]
MDHQGTAEGRKVTWPTRKETVVTTVMVGRSGQGPDPGLQEAVRRDRRHRQGEGRAGGRRSQVRRHPGCLLRRTRADPRSARRLLRWPPRRSEAPHPGRRLRRPSRLSRSPAGQRDWPGILLGHSVTRTERISP